MSVFDDINGPELVASGELTQRQINEMSRPDRKRYLDDRAQAKGEPQKPTGSVFDQINGPQVSFAGPVDPNATPDAPTWIGRRIQDVVGRQDQRFKDLPVFRPDQAGFDAVGKGNYVAGAMLGNTDEGMADAIQGQLGPRFIKRENDANGYPIIHYYDPQGKSTAAYVNKPGLDLQDVGRAVAGSIPYAITGGVVGAGLKVAGPAVNAIAQSATAGTTNLGVQLSRSATGSAQPLDPIEAGLTAVAGGAVPAVNSTAGALLRRFVTVPGLIDTATGQLTARGVAAAQRAGLDPKEISPEVAKAFVSSLSKTGDEAQAAVSATTGAFGIPVSKGQVTKDPFLLTQEEAMRRHLMGDQAYDVMKGLDKAQAQAIKDAALGSESLPGSGRPSVASTINPDRAPGRYPSDSNPATLGQSIREGAQAARQGAADLEDKAWENTRLDATPPALQLLGPKVSDAIRSSGIAPSKEITPATHAMGELLDSFIAGEAPVASSAKVFGAPSMTTNVGEMRKQLLARMQGAQTPTDKAAARSVYGAFNDWIGDASDKALFAGDPGAAAQMKVARAFTAELHGIFSPKNAAGRTTPAANRIAQVLDGADTPEGVVQALFGSQGSKTINQGGVGALRSIKGALDKYAEPEIAAQTWNDIRLAYWVRLVQGKNGELLGPTAMMNNIKNAFSNQESAVSTLYSRNEQMKIRLFVRALEAVSYKPPNASGSGYSATQLIGGPLSKLFEAFGLNTRLAKTAIEYSGVNSAYGTAAAKAAVSPSSFPVNPNLVGPTVGVSNALARPGNDRATAP